MAEVFRGEIEGAAGFSKPVAIKRVRAALAQDPHIREMFVQEARVARRMEHGNIVQIYDLGIEDGVPYLVIELVDGLSLAEILDALRDAGGRLSVAEILYCIESVAAALHHAHRLRDESGRPAGVIHRDVTPRNILISRDGVVKLADFGIAKARHLPSETLPGTIKGTLGYLSPEQADGAPVDARSDQFSVGLVLYELLAGENPLAATSSIQAYTRMLSQGIPPLPRPDAAPGESNAHMVPDAQVDDALAAIVRRLVAIEPAERFPSLADVQAELEAWRVARGIRSSPDGLGRRVRALLGRASTGPIVRLAPVDDRSIGQNAGQPPKRAGQALGRALEAELDARAPRRTRAHQPAANTHTVRAGHGRRLALAMVIGLSGLAALGWLLLRQPAAPGPALASQPAPAAAPDPAQPEAAGMPVTDAPPSSPPKASHGDPPAQAAPDSASDPRPPARDATSDRAPSTGARASATRRPPDGSRDPGRIKINLIPYARVRVNGKLLGTTPVDASLPPGTHTLVLENPDTGQRDTRTLRLAPGEILNIHSW